MYAPDAVYYECMGIFAKYVRRGALDPKDARKHLMDFRRIDIHTLASTLLMEDAFELALQYMITPYDCCYVAMAARYGFPLLTADERLCHALAGTRYEPILLEQMQ